MSVISDPTSVSDHSLLSRKHPRSSNTTTRLLLGYGFCKAWRDRTEGCLHQPTATIRQWNHYGVHNQEIMETYSS
nr:hypothetical protein CFP56_70697 [Quercus suber]